MEKLKEKNTNKNIAPYSDAIKERKINAVDILQELHPLLEEYFIGEFVMKDNAIQLNFLNGQKFELKVRELICG